MCKSSSTPPSECPWIKDEDIERDTEMGTLVVNYDRFAKEDDEWTEAYDRCKKQLLDAIELKKEVDDIKANMKTSEYLYSGEFSKIIMDRITKIFGDKMIQ